MAFDDILLPIPKEAKFWVYCYYIVIRLLTDLRFLMSSFSICCKAVIKFAYPQVLCFRVFPRFLMWLNVCKNIQKEGKKANK